MSSESLERMEESASQLSAMFDGELSAAECELLSRRLARDEILRGRWARYALIGAALRAEPIATVSGGFARRVGAAIDGQAVVATPVRVRRLRRLRTIAIGGGLAAGVAAAAVLLLRSEMLAQIAAPLTAASRAITPSAAMPSAAVAVPGREAAPSADSDPASYVVPPGPSAGQNPLPITLANYVVAHSEYSSPLVRRGLLSALAAGDATLRLDAGPSVVIVDEGNEAGR